jgi:hypothetical protein
MKAKYCQYCGEPLTEHCDCARIAAEEEEQWLEDYYNDPEVQAGWRNQDLIDMRRREQ